MRVRLAVLLAAAALLTACTSSSAPRPTPSRSGAAACRAVCTGTLDGAGYAIRVPEHWNGTLLLYSHGLQTSDANRHPYLSQEDTTGRGEDRVSRRLLAAGYALAGSAYRGIGWVVADALGDDARLYREFARRVGKPTRTIVWGSSMGGLITELLAERASWVDGAAALCGAVAGPLDNADNLARALAALQVATGVPLVLTGSETAQRVYTLLAQGTARIEALAADTRDGGAATLLAVAALLGLPDRSEAYPASTLAGRARAAAQNLTTYLTLALSEVHDLADRYGADFADPRLADARVDLTAAQRAAVSALHGDPAALQRAIRAVAVPPTVPASRARVEASGDPTGRLRVPLLTVHGEDDPAVIVANETVLRERVAAVGEQARLRQVYVAPADAGANPAYGVGHCVFSAQQQVGAVLAADRWARTGAAPGTAALAGDLGPGVDPGYRPPGWPVR